MTNCLGVVGNEYGVYATRRTSYMDVLSKRYSGGDQFSFVSRFSEVFKEYLKTFWSSTYL